MTIDSDSACPSPDPVPPKLEPHADPGAPGATDPAGVGPPGDLIVLLLTAVVCLSRAREECEDECDRLREMVGMGVEIPL